MPLAKASTFHLQWCTLRWNNDITHVYTLANLRARSRMHTHVRARSYEENVPGITQTASSGKRRASLCG